MTWLDVPPGSAYGPDHLPYGIISTPDRHRRVAVAIGDQVIDLATLAEAAGRPERVVFAAPYLNAFLALGPTAWGSVREWLTDLITDERHRPVVEPHLLPAAAVESHLPVDVADFVDFYASRHHAENLGRLLRPDSPALPAAWTHLPIGYHGRAGTVVVSGTDVVRPCGQRRPNPAAEPVFGPSARLDLEAEVGFVVGVASRLGEPVPIERFAEHVFGVVLVNDWSARDIQAFEYVPLGPFLGKSFATSIGGWVTPLAALQAARVAPPPLDPPPLAHLREPPDQPWGLDLRLEVEINATVLARPPFAGMAWTAAQQLAHLTSNGAALRTGDLFASGTVSGPDRDQRGSLVELSWNGTEPVRLADDSTRTFLADGDEVVIRASAPSLGGGRLGLAPVAGRVLPAPRQPP